MFAASVHLGVAPHNVDIAEPLPGFSSVCFPTLTLGATSSHPCLAPLVHPADVAKRSRFREIGWQDPNHWQADRSTITQT